MKEELIFENEYSLGTVGAQCANTRQLVCVTLGEIRHNFGLTDEGRLTLGEDESPGSVRVDSSSGSEAYVTKYHSAGRTTFEIMDSCAVVRVHEYDASGSLLSSGDIQDTEEGYLALDQLHKDLFDLNK